MSAPQDPAGNRDRAGRFVAGKPSANPGGRPRNPAGFTARARELSVDVLEHFATLARGRSMAAVKAGELVLAYAHGKPEASLNVRASRMTELPEAFVAGAAGVLERALAEEDAADTFQLAAEGAPVSETAALPDNHESPRDVAEDGKQVDPTLAPEDDR